MELCKSTAFSVAFAPYALFALTLSIAACNAQDTQDDSQREVDAGLVARLGKITYFQHTKPIFDAKCGLCHVQNGVGPMALDTYKNVKMWAPQIKASVADRRMPPWYAAPDCNEYVGDRSLTDEQREVIAAWVDGGALKGDPNSEAKPLRQDKNDFSADVVLTMSEDYTPTVMPDEYRCFLLDWPLDDSAFIAGVGLRPGNEAMVHHSVLYLIAPEDVETFRQYDADEDGPGYTCFSGSFNSGGSLISAIEKAEAGRVFPAGTGLNVKPGSVILMQQHYNTLATGGSQSDRSSVQFMVKSKVKNPATAQWFVNPLWTFGQNMLIPANEPDVIHSYQSAGSFTATGPQVLYWADLHMHQLGSRGELSLIRADGTRECLLRIDDWRFEWQETYLLKHPVTMYAGDQLYLECHFDNTKGHQIVIDGKRQRPVDVSWGDRSQDEMCLGNFLMAPADE